MSDAASSFNFAAERMNVTHILCVQHYRNKKNVVRRTISRTKLGL